MLNGHLIARTAPAALPENRLRWKNIRITLLTDRLIRLEQPEPASASGSEACFLDEATQAVWFRDHPAVSHTCEMGPDCCVVETASLRLEVREDLAASRVFLKNMPPKKPSAPVTLGEAEALPGTCRTLDNCDGDIVMPFAEDPMQAFRLALDPGVVSRRGVAVMDDSASLVLGADGMPHPRSHPEKDWYLFCYGHDYRGAIRALFRLCQAPPVIPRFALGNWWSRYHVYTQDEYTDLMRSFEDRRIPFTVATVDMDWHPSRDLPDGADGWTGYTWNRSLFPDYRRFLRDLHGMGLRVTLNLHPALGVRWFEKAYPEMARRLGVDPDSRAPIPFDLTDERFIEAYFDVLHHPYEAEGVDFWWIDWQQGESSAVPGLDPLWSLNHFHWLDSNRTETDSVRERSGETGLKSASGRSGLILSRYAGLGSHRYPLGFSGDTHMTWDTLRFLPGFTAGASNAGYTWWSHDIGGHMLGCKNDELYCRFIQFGVFSPINRIHSSCSPMLVKDPAAYPGGVGLIAREFLQLRHAMLPFLYTASRRTADQGLALIEPMYYEWPEEEEAYRCPGQYLFGAQLIASPITDPAGPGGLSVREVWLPEGRWTDLFSGLTYTGGEWKKMVRGLESFPLLLREGGFFVLDAAPEGNSVRLPDRLRVIMAAGTGEYTLEEEAGGEILRTLFRLEAAGENFWRLTFTPPRPLSVHLEFRDILAGSASLRVGGQPAACHAERALDYTVVRLPDLSPNVAVELIVKETASSLEKRNAAVTRILGTVQADNRVKERLHRHLTEARNLTQFEAAIRLAGLKDAERLQLLEIEW